ncbi:MAG: D-aminoacyl-tRNA deacylase [Kangiellaceae bacterium]|jgi:D-tyrosyl-tRNA(Tyr) deacylase|nr:D-aminoacyl-tRNA deacylase [Kangiellaceae bacterium]
MIGLIQRVTNASVVVNEKTIGQIQQGSLVLIGVEKNDTSAQAKRLAERVIGYRLFSDNQGKMNLNISQVNGGLLLVPQFTLAADTNSGLRPSFSSAKPPAEGKELFEEFVNICRAMYSTVETGEYGADMKVSLCNDGPVTFWLQV